MSARSVDHTLHRCGGLDALPSQYELDSLCSFMKLSRSYYQATNDTSFINDECAPVSLPSSTHLTHLRRVRLCPQG